MELIETIECIKREVSKSTQGVTEDFNALAKEADKLKGLLGGLKEPTIKLEFQLYKLALAAGETARTLAEARYWFGQWLATRYPVLAETEAGESTLYGVINKLETGYSVYMGKQQISWAQYFRPPSLTPEVAKTAVPVAASGYSVMKDITVTATMTLQELSAVLKDTTLAGKELATTIGDVGRKAVGLAYVAKSLLKAGDDVEAKLKSLGIILGKIAGDVAKAWEELQTRIALRIADVLSGKRDTFTKLAKDLQREGYEEDVFTKRLQMLEAKLKGNYLKASREAFELFLQTGDKAYLEFAEAMMAKWKAVKNKVEEAKELRLKLVHEMDIFAETLKAETAKLTGQYDQLYNAYMRLFEITGKPEYVTKAKEVETKAKETMKVRETAKTELFLTNVKEASRRIALAIARGAYDEAYRTALSLAQETGNKVWLKLAESLRALKDESEKASDALQKLSIKLGKLSAIENFAKAVIGAFTGGGARQIAEAYRALAEAETNPTKKQEYVKKAEAWEAKAETEAQKRYGLAKLLLEQGTGPVIAVPQVKPPSSAESIEGALKTVVEAYVQGAGVQSTTAIKATKLIADIQTLKAMTNVEASKYATEVAENFVANFSYYFATETESALKAKDIGSLISRMITGIGGSIFSALDSLKELIGRAAMLGLSDIAELLTTAFRKVQNALLANNEALEAVATAYASTLAEKTEDFERVGIMAVAKLRSVSLNLSFNMFNSIQNAVSSLDELIGWLNSLRIDTTGLKNVKNELLNLLIVHGKEYAEALATFTAIQIKTAIKILKGVGGPAIFGLRLAAPNVPSSRMEAVGAITSTLNQLTNLIAILTVMGQTNMVGKLNKMAGALTALLKEVLPGALEEFTNSLKAFVEAVADMNKKLSGVKEYQQIANIAQSLAGERPMGPFEKASFLLSAYEKLFLLKTLFVKLGRTDLAEAIGAEIEKITPKVKKPKEAGATTAVNAQKLIPIAEHARLTRIS